MLDPTSGESDVRLLDEMLTQRSVRCVYQPIVELATGAVVGYEALARGPLGSRLEQPALMFAAAGRGRRLVELDRTCRTAALTGARSGGLSTPLTLFVNVEPEAAATALATGSTHRPPPRGAAAFQVVMELTERALTARPAELLLMVDRARERGWGVALDDVGADPASLALLPLLRPDVIKLDLSLVQQRPSAQVARIVSAVNAEAERSGSVVLAEGIETPEHVVVALSLGASLGQGYLLGRPAPLPTTWPDQVTAPLRLRARSALPLQRSPFALAAATRPVKAARKALLIEISKHLERRAVESGESAVVISTFQDARFFTAATADRYAALARGASFVGALGVGMPTVPVPGVRGATLSADDPLLGEWDIVVLGPHFAATLVARDLGDDGPDAERRFEFVMSHDRDLATDVATTLMSRMAPVGRPGELPELPGPARPARPAPGAPARPRTTRPGVPPGAADAAATGVAALPAALSWLQAPPLLLARALDATATGLTIADVTLPDAPLVYVNSAFEAITGYGTDDALGRNCRFLQGPGTDPRAVAALALAVREGRSWRTRLLNYRPDGGTWWNEVDLSPVHDEGGRVTHYIGVQNDVTARLEAEDRVRYLAYHDVLTGLPNRALLQDHMHRALERGARLGTATALLFIDLDEFKAVNDRHGHAVGDEVLRQVAARLRAATRTSDHLARHGGDEFMLLLSDLDPDDAPQVAERVATQLRAALADPVDLGALTPSGGSARLGACVGIALAPHDGRTPDDLLRHADAAMYRAKRSGPGQQQRWTPAQPVADPVR